MIDEDFYEDDEPIERIQAIRARPHDLVTAPPAPRAVTLYVLPTTEGRWETRYPNIDSETACH
ncbi:MAG: hypothetical protein M3332_10305 [Actinomycetota bacterium]|nr:hypothetical protein [Actinomycetota bacterium]